MIRFSIPPERRSRIFDISLPIMGGMVSQNILNIIDAAMVGALENSETDLAAVGIASIATFMCVALITGLSTAVQAIAARRKGEGEVSNMAESLNGGLFLSLALGLPMMVFFMIFAGSIMRGLLDSPAVIAVAIPYFQMRIAGMIFVGMNFSFRGYFNAVDLSRLYMRTIIMMHITNVLLNYLLIFGNFGFPKMGATGAGLATTISIVFGTLYYFYLGHVHAKDNGFLSRIPSMEALKSMVRLALPSSVQQVFFAAGLTAQFWIINQMGEDEGALAHVITQLTLVCILPSIGMGLAAASLVGQALGRRDPDDAYQWGWDVGSMAFVIISLIALPFILLPETILSGFIHTESVLEKGRIPLMLVGIGIGFDAVGLVLMNALLGAGAARSVMLVSMSLQWLLFLPVAFLLGPYFELGLVAVWLAQMVYRAIQTVIFVRLWQARQWQSIKV